MLSWLEADSSRPAAIPPARLTPLLPRPYLAVHGGVDPASMALERVLIGNAAPVDLMAWSSDGQYLATADSPAGLAPGAATIRVWDPATGHNLATLADHFDRVLAIAWSPDDRYLVTTGYDQIAVGHPYPGSTALGQASIRVWNPTAGIGSATMTVGTCHGAALHWSIGRARLATAADFAVGIWDPITAERQTTLIGHRHYVVAMAWSPDGARLATASHDDTIRLWDAATGKSLSILASGMGKAFDMAWSPDGVHLAVRHIGSGVRLYNSRTGEYRLTISGKASGVQTLAWSPDGARLATAGDDRVIRLWDITGQNVATLTTRTAQPRAMAWSPDGRYLVTAGDDGLIFLWNPAADDVRRDHTSAEYDADGRGAHTMAWSPNGRFLAMLDHAGAARLWNATSEDTSVLVTERVGTIAWSSDSRRLATTHHSGIRFWDPVTTENLATHFDGTAQVLASAWSPDGTCLATTHTDRVTRLRDTVTGEVLATLRDRAIFSGYSMFPPEMAAVAWSPDGSSIAVSIGYDSVRLWRRAGGSWFRRLSRRTLRHPEPVQAVEWSPDGTLLATTGTDGILRIWDAASGRATAEVPTDNLGSVHSVAWSPDGTYLATADDTGLVIVRDRQLREVASLQLKPSRCLAWSAPRIAVGQPGRPAILELRDPANLGR
jgi:WD40 repeat protein